MLKRIYINNYKCLVNFEIHFEEMNLWLGVNGSGKSSVFEVLAKLQKFITGEVKTDVFPATCLTRWQNSINQQFELEVEGNGGRYLYKLELENDIRRNRSRVLHEVLSMDGKPLFEFHEGLAQLYHDDFIAGPEVHFDWCQSGVGFLPVRPDNTKLAWFRKFIDLMMIVRLNPYNMSSESRREEKRLLPNMENFSDWYRHESQEYQGRAFDLKQALCEVLDGFDSLNMKEAGEDLRIMKASFKFDKGNKDILYKFDELSEGQRALIILYALLFFDEDEYNLLCIDEPENFIALTEIQPWLNELQRRTSDGKRQAIIISHHPEFMDNLGSWKGYWFSRGPQEQTRVKRVKANPEQPLKISELIARGWIDE